ncbi:hypothetical protein [Streptomyces noursei]|uniref:Uncharacterized protein n=1 Tax=Streptomyces noursei TaxID=1971 RepID=A0A2N8PHT5_STRNR|nr:hypothetical protein [Streptomyces noursei]PNE40579.1 hypothetical protein AOB60_06745 [Streptomyces noursei]
MLELNCAACAPTTGLGEVLAGQAGSSATSHRRDGQQLAWISGARRITPPVRSLPRRGSY